MINRFALSFLCIELDRTRNVRGHATLYTTDVKVGLHSLVNNIAFVIMQHQMNYLNNTM